MSGSSRVSAVIGVPDTTTPCMPLTLLLPFGLDPQAKNFTEPPDQIKQVIAALKVDKSVSEAERKEYLGQLEAALKKRKADTIQGKHCW